ncbi:Crp/Fnr family transcriptional regulator, partial [Rhizobium ruizarguesonis]
MRMDGATHTSDRRAGISKQAISANGSIHLNSHIVIDDEFLSCRSSVRRFRRGEVIAGAGVLVDT